MDDGLPPILNENCDQVRFALTVPTVKDRVVQMAVKIVLEPLFEADFLPCSFGFRPKKTPRMALGPIVQSIHEGYCFVVDVDLKSYLDPASYCPRVDEKVGLSRDDFDSQTFAPSLSN